VTTPHPQCDNSPVHTGIRAELERAVKLFNSGDFFAAHEVLEDAWRAAAPEQKPFLQGLVQVAVAFHHHSTGNRVGAISVLKKARHNIERGPAVSYGIELDGLLTTLRGWQDALESEQLEFPAIPTIVLDRGDSS